MIGIRSIDSLQIDFFDSFMLTTGKFQNQEKKLGSKSLHELLLLSITLPQDI